MLKQSNAIPVNLMANESGWGMAIERLTVESLEAAGMQEARRSHREDGYSFFLLEGGIVSLEIDFQEYTLVAPSLVYIHPSQVHRILRFENVTVSSWSLTAEQLNPEYLKLLEGLAPATPLLLSSEIVSLIKETVNLCLRFLKRNQHRFYQAIIRDSCNTLVALVLSELYEYKKTEEMLSRADVVTRNFKQLLEQQYTRSKRPATYAEQLHLSIPYLNECVRASTGYSVSQHIQQRIILEAKRLLVHSDRSVKEIASELGYDDLPYFSRLFMKSTGLTALAFRRKNLA